jgi:ATP-binding cassette, subfamily G (WHITE), member 2, PDR
VLANPDTLPHFWIFMYRISPFTYLISGMLATAVANTEVVCADNELLRLQPPQGTSCGQYMGAYLQAAGGYLVDANSTDSCAYCAVSDTNVFLQGVRSNYADRWRNFGIVWIYVVFNVFGALGLYWLVRVPKKKGIFGKKKQE